MILRTVGRHGAAVAGTVALARTPHRYVSLLLSHGGLVVAVTRGLRVLARRR